MIEEGLGDYANPESILQATAMMLDHIGCVRKAEVLRRAVSAVKEQGIVVTGQREKATCAAFTAALTAQLNA